MASVTSPANSGGSKSEALLGLPIRLQAETVLFICLLALTVITRFTNLGQRVMSHDETTHVYFSWLLEQGRGYQHDPLSHGPLQFHLIALSYLLFGDSDATARVPAAVFGVLAVAFVWTQRRWLGRWGTMAAGAMMAVSPFMLYYSRYARNEAFVVVEGLLLFWAVFRYLESSQSKWLYLLAADMALHFATKETAFIYTAQILIFVGLIAARDLIMGPWKSSTGRNTFGAGLLVAVGGAGLALISFLHQRTSAGEAPDLTPTPWLGIGFVVALLGLAMLTFALYRAFEGNLRKDFPALDLLVVLGTLTLPQLAALPAQALGWNPLSYSDPVIRNQTVIVVVVLLLVAALIGYFWNWRRWLISAGVFFAIFIPLYTTLFTNPFGFYTGLVGSLGYWLVQQGVQRGSQPLYYYALIQLPIYEFLPLIGVLLAGVNGLRRSIGGGRPGGAAPADQASDHSRLYLIFLGYWVITALVMYSFAGERMPWLTVHIVWPMILLAGWAYGRCFEAIDWRRLLSWRGAAMLGLGLLGLLALGRSLGYLFGAQPPFQGMDLAQLQATTGLLTALAVLAGSIIGIVALRRGWTFEAVGRLAAVSVLAILFLLTLRASFRAAFVNYDDATEFLVYAHGARGPGIAMSEITDLSIRTTGDLTVGISYDNQTSYPFWWYLRNFPNAHYFGETPSRDIANDPLVLAGSANWGKVESILRDRYYVFEYTRLWWPMQEYFNLTWERIWGALSSPGYRQALWDIWFNRDYTEYGKMIEKDFSLNHWDPSERMRLYVRKDVAASIWQYGLAASVEQPQPVEDPYAAKMITLDAQTTFGQQGSDPGQFNNPHGIAVAGDGSVYVVDTMNNRIQHLSASGEVLQVWGQKADVSQGQAPGGTFNEPWGIAVAPDGSVYVADTWNHRIQHFTADGKLLGMFGTFGQGETPLAFYGPRDVAVDSSGRIFVTDTGNKRVVVFNSDGSALTEFGGLGLDAGQLDEPVGIAIGPDGRVYVADTWNQRIQVFLESSDGQFESVAQWPVDGWFGQSVDNKPYLDVAPDGDVCTSDPEGYRVLCFDSTGAIKLGWGDYGIGASQFSLPDGIAIDPTCQVWVVDSADNRVMRFVPPLCP
jgi:uncharacterized protein (TIGR03663 family)